MRLAIASALLLLLAACGSTAAPAAAPSQAASASAPSDWDSILAAAKREGTVAVAGPSGDKREALTQGFEKQYGIKVDYLGRQSSEMGPRISAERAAGQYLRDVLVGGQDTPLDVFIPKKALQPLDSALILPEVKDPKNWRGGAIEYLDAGHQVLVMTPYLRGMLYYNTNQLKASDFTSYKQLLDPKWNGKIVVDDPRRSGPGQTTFMFYYLAPDLGPDFIRGLGKQNVTLLTNYQQEIDSVGQGRFPLLTGTGDANVLARQKAGVPIGLFDPRTMKEGSQVSSGDGNLSLFNHAPHPNAATVYINWLLSKSGQSDFANANGYVSARVDVPPPQDQEVHVPVPGAMKSYDQAAIDAKPKLQALLKEVFG